jgi:hypothetical protein
LSDPNELPLKTGVAGRDSVEPVADVPDNVIAVEPRGWRRFLPFLLVLFFLGLFVRLVFPGWFNLAADPNAAMQNAFVRSVNTLSILAIPFLLSYFPVYAATRRIKVYEELGDLAGVIASVIICRLVFA